MHTKNTHILTPGEMARRLGQIMDPVSTRIKGVSLHTPRTPPPLTPLFNAITENAQTDLVLVNTRTARPTPKGDWRLSPPLPDPLDKTRVCDDAQIHARLGEKVTGRSPLYIQTSRALTDKDLPGSRLLDDVFRAGVSHPNTPSDPVVALQGLLSVLTHVKSPDGGASPDGAQAGYRLVMDHLLSSDPRARLVATVVMGTLEYLREDRPLAQENTLVNALAKGDPFDLIRRGQHAENTLTDQALLERRNTPIEGLGARAERLHTALFLKIAEDAPTPTLDTVKTPTLEGLKTPTLGTVKIPSLSTLRKTPKSTPS
jgi:hypothetical protein